MNSSEEYEKIMSDRKIFNDFVYTPLSEALKILEERNNNPETLLLIENLLKGDIPEIFKNKKCAVLCRQVATPNNETRRFISIAKDNGLIPVLLEYREDKFTSNNSYKYSLAQLGIHNGSNHIDKINIIDISKHDGKKFHEIKTLWDEPLIDFHKKLFQSHKYDPNDLNFFDVSEWLKNNGNNALKYYTNLLLLFTCNGILFENFLTSENNEGDFTKNIVLPSIKKVTELTRLKPLIVPFEPLDLENEKFWYNHLEVVKQHIPKK